MSPAGSGSAVESPRVLVVDDEQFLRKLYRRTLEAEGWLTLEAPDGESAWATLQSRPNIAVVVTDILMPGLTGAELAERIHARGATPLVLLVSAYTPDELAHQGIRVPESPLLLKPFNPGQLVQAVRTLLERVQGHAGRPSPSE
jgi:CheY-like chemotaxis protein